MTWSPVSRIPLDPVGSNLDHFIPGIAVNPTSAGAHTQLALTYYFDTNPNCTGTACQIQVGFSSSLDNGHTWSTPQALTDPMQLGWLAPTTQGLSARRRWFTGLRCADATAGPAVPVRQPRSSQFGNGTQGAATGPLATAITIRGGRRR